MRRRPTLTTSRTVAVFEEMLWFRRELYRDDEFFKMTDVWRTLSNDIDEWKIATYRSNQKEDYKRKAGVVVLGDQVTLTVDEQLMSNADKRCNVSNFILAHELGHVVLDHHARNAVTKNFQLFAGPNGMKNMPPTQEELEANYAAVFFQCGAALLNEKWDPDQLARRSHSDFRLVKNLRGLVQLDVFKRTLARSKPKFIRVVL